MTGRAQLVVRTISLTILGGFLLAACGVLRPPGAPANPGYGVPPQGSFTSNGQQIYFTATDLKGQSISYTGGPDFGGMMMGGYLTCSACHGPDGHGGAHCMHMQVMDAPPIYYAALVTMKASDAGATPEPNSYTIADFRQEVVDGRDTNGDPLDPDMPHWQISDTDLQDLFSYLKTLH